MSEPSTFKERLEAIHTFPTQFMVKAIGLNTPEFIENVSSVSKKTLTKIVDLNITTIPSSKEKFISLRISFTAPDSDTIVNLYQALGHIDGLKFLA